MALHHPVPHGLALLEMPPRFHGQYATNDLVERAFVVWALILAIIWGNNATLLFNSDSQSNLAIGIYLVWRGSVLLCEACYAFFIHQIRNRIIIQTLVIIPVLPLWVVAGFYGIEVKAGLAFAAVVVETMAQILRLALRCESLPACRRQR